MIMQAEKPIRIFGEGLGNICVKIGENLTKIKAENGHFFIELPARSYGETADISISDADGEVILHDVLFGDVYLFAGQSNMAYRLKAATEDGEAFECPDIRVFSSESALNEERFVPEDGWLSLDCDTSLNISAIAYFTARELYKKKNRPIGIITAHQGASVIQSWMPPSALSSLGLDIKKEELYSDHTHEIFSRFNGEGFLYKLDIKPLLPTQLSAVIWYQGESNCSDAEARVYDELLKGLISSWREAFKSEKLPFVVVQIADFDGRDTPAWHEIQEKQREVCEAFPFCKLAVSRDVCERDNIHPQTKHKLAKRIAEALL